jgi:hypothetical protein
VSPGDRSPDRQGPVEHSATARRAVRGGAGQFTLSRLANPSMSYRSATMEPWSSTDSSYCTPIFRSRRNAFHMGWSEVGCGEYREAASSRRRVGLQDCKTNSCRCFDTCNIAPRHAVLIACTTAVGFAACTDRIASGEATVDSLAASASASCSAISQKWVASPAPPPLSDRK